MTIKYGKVDKRWIIKAIENQPLFHIRRGIKPIQSVGEFWISRNDDYIHFEIIDVLHKDRKRPDTAVINGDMIDKIQKKYMFCSASPSKNGMYCVLKRDRWNECNDCGKILWEERWNGREEIHNYGEIELYNNKSLCPRCYKIEKRKKNK